MKTLKRAEVDSFELDMTMYNTYNAKEMLDSNSDIFYVNDEYDVVDGSENYKGEPLRINHKAVEEIKVIYSKDFDCYMNTVKDKEGNTYFVKL